MTVKELIAKLRDFPADAPVYVESAPWGSPYEVEIVRAIRVGEEDTGVLSFPAESKRGKQGVFVTHNVGY